MILAGLINICGSNIRQTRILVVKTVHSAYLATSHQHNNNIDISSPPHRSGLEMLECGLTVSTVQVSWIRQSDLHILTVGEHSYTNSLKFFPTHPPGSDEWNLR